MTTIHTIKNNFDLPVTKTISTVLHYSKEQYTYDVCERVTEYCLLNQENIPTRKTTYQNMYNEHQHILNKTETVCVYMEVMPKVR